MSVDPINYLASSRYEKSETTTMKLLLLFTFVAGAVAAHSVSDAEQAERFAKVFRITQEQGLECIKKTNVTNDHLKKMAESLEHTESEITDMKSVKTGSCAILCCAQKKGIMVGKEIQLVQVFQYIEKFGLPKEVSDAFSYDARICKEQVADTEDECMVAYRFLKCMSSKSLAIYGAK